MAKKLGIDARLKNCRHYSATELILAGVDLRTVAGRLGHSGGGTTTLRVYTAWLAEADQRAATTLSGRMPALPVRAKLALPATKEPAENRPSRASRAQDGPFQKIADDLRGAIRCGLLLPGSPLPPVKTLAERYNVAPSTGHRAFAILKECSLVEGSRGRRTTVAHDV